MKIIDNIPASFYLGRLFDLEQRDATGEVLQYEAKQLTTHAMCVGMTGSGKTGLCLSLLEEAALDGVPVVCIDPKGDLGNLLLTFPDLSPGDFLPWVDRAEALANWNASEGDVSDEVKIQRAAEAAAAAWSAGLEKSGLGRAALENLRSIEKTIYTPGSTIGVPLTVLRSFDAPSANVRQDPELFREQISVSASGLLSLLGIDADPLTSREHILLSTILAHAWQQGTNVSMEDLIRGIQSPPVTKIGVMDLESVFPTAERVKLAMSLNNLLASPAFAGWLQGQSLHMQDLLFDAQGKPKISIVSIAHLNDSERMFFVTLLLNELVSWMRSQPGTSALRAIFYMDEVYGYFPPSSKPPSKGPMMTLLKQARAFGLGIVLATQNPVDLDYKGLSNMGTWFLGRLQTQRDKDRVLDGLEGASAQQGRGFDRQAMDRMLSGLGKRVFLMNNVHEREPVVFQSRFALSYLRGPLSRAEISQLMQSQRAAVLEQPSESLADPKKSVPEEDNTKRRVTRSLESNRPIIPAGINELFVVPPHAPSTQHASGTGTRGIPSAVHILRPALLASASIHFVRASSNVDMWRDLELLLPIEGKVPYPLWDSAFTFAGDTLASSADGPADIPFAEVPAELLSAKNYKAWEKELAEFLFRHEKCTVFSCKAIKQVTAPGLEEFEARHQMAQAAREIRDQEMDKIRDKFDDKLRAFEGKVNAARTRLDRHVEQAKSKRMEGLVNVGTTILGALLGSRRRSGATTAVRDLAKASSKQPEIDRALESLEELVAQKDELERECEREIADIQRRFSIENLELESMEVPLRKSDTKVRQLTLAWVPWSVDEQGHERPLLPKEITAS